MGLAAGGELIVTAAYALGLDGPGVFHPAEMVDDVDVEVAEAAAACPEEAVESPNLVFQVGDIGRLGGRGERADGAGHAVATHQDDLTDLSIGDPLLQFLERLGMARHQSDANLQVLGCRFLGQLEQPLAHHSVGGERLFHEDVEPLLDGISEMHPPKRQRRGKDHHVPRLEAVHGVLIRVEADELTLGGNVDLPCEGTVIRKPLVRVLQAVLVSVGHGDELGGGDLELQRNACPGHAVPRPPQPTSATWMIESPTAAWTFGIASPAMAETAATWPARLPSSRREIPVFSLEFIKGSFAKRMRGKNMSHFQRPKAAGHHCASLVVCTVSRG